MLIEIKFLRRDQWDFLKVKYGTLVTPSSVSRMISCITVYRPLREGLSGKAL